MTKQEQQMEFFKQVYAILVKYAGAQSNSNAEFDFVYAHAHDKDECTEYRFCGALGHGGKYRSGTNKVDCYVEDSTPEREKMIVDTNKELAKLIH